MRLKHYICLLLSLLPALGGLSQPSLAGVEQKRAEAMMGNFMQSQASPNFSITHCRFVYDINPAIKEIQGYVTSSFITSASASFIVYDLTDQLTVDSVLYHSGRISFTRPGNQTLQVHFPSALPANTLDSINIYYHGVPSNRGFGSFSQSSHSGVPVLWTLSEPYGSMDWWPCKNGLEDKVDSIDVLITTPDQYFASSNGLLQFETINGGKRTVWWKHRYPIAPYLVAFAATNYQIRKDTVHLKDRVLNLEHYMYPEWADTWNYYLDETKFVMRLYDQWIGTYPFSAEKYAHTQISAGGGMEHQTSSFMGYADNELIAHELAHQWFGDKITCGSWQHIWLNEGFATFFAREHFAAMETPAQMLARYQADITRMTARADGSVFVTDTTNPSRIFNYDLTYLKGSWVLRMLQWKLGKDLLLQGIRDYLNDPALQYRFARTEDLRGHLERVSGTSLETFFNNWIYGEGFPSYELRWMPLGNAKVQLTLAQTTSHPSVAFYAMPVPILFSDGVHDSLVVIDHRQNNQTQMVDLGFVPTTAKFDPELRILSAGNQVKRLDAAFAPNTVKVYPNPVGARFSVLLGNYQDKTADITIHNAAGQRVFAQSLQMPGGNDLVNIASASWASGVYFIRVQSANTHYVQRIVK